MEFLTTQQVAAELQVSVETVRRLIRSGALRASSLETPPGRAGYRVRRDDLEALLDARARGGSDPNEAKSQRPRA